MISFEEVSTLVSDNVKYKQTKVNTFTLNSLAVVESFTGSGVCYQSNIKSGGLRSQLEASRVPSHTEKLW